MKALKRWLLGGVLLGLGVWLWTILFPSPESVIRKRLTEIARYASFPANEGNFARLNSVRQLASDFSPDVEIILDAPGHGQQIISGRDELMRAAMAARNAFSAFQVEFLDASIELGPDKQSALVDLTARGNTPTEKNFVIQEMKFTLKHVDGQWRVTRAETVKTLQ